MEIDSKIFSIKISFTTIATVAHHGEAITSLLNDKFLDSFTRQTKFSFQLWCRGELKFQFDFSSRMKRDLRGNQASQSSIRLKSMFDLNLLCFLLLFHVWFRAEFGLCWTVFVIHSRLDWLQERWIRWKQTAEERKLLAQQFSELWLSTFLLMFVTWVCFAYSHREECSRIPSTFWISVFHVLCFMSFSLTKHLHRSSGSRSL